ncbi:MAG: hypothetical protein JWP29_2006 [Rhodoferax sp.]|nr:hypothetical protein [Rhodoferax sp.]
MAGYTYKCVLRVLPESYKGEGFKARNGSDYEGDAGYDGDIHVAASDYIDDARALLTWLVENSGECIGDHPEKLAQAQAMLAPSGW